MKTERRKFDRYALPKETIYVISHNSDIGGWLKNISKGGVAFAYQPTSGHKMEPTSFIILSGNRVPFYLTGIPCKLIYEIKTIEENHTFSGQENMLCGLQYGMLAAGMKGKLESLIKKIK